MSDQDKEFHKIKNKLKQLPKIEDRRTKEEIYAQVVAKMAEPKKRSHKAWFIPVALSSVAILLLIFLLPNFAPNDVAINERNPVMESNEEQEEAMIFVEKDTSLDERMNYVYAVKENDLWEGSKVVTIPYLEPTNSLIVPLSFIIENNEVQLEQVEELITHFDPRFFGLKNTLLKEVRLHENDEQELVVNIENAKLDENNKELFTQAIGILGKSLYYERVLFEGENVTIYRYGYFLYETNTGQQMLIPVVVDGATFSDTLEKMKEASSDVYQPSIPNDVTWDIEESGNVVIIQFHEPHDINDSMIEAILLVARDFSYEFVQFHGRTNEEMSRYNFAEPISTKLAPNGV